MPGWLCSVCLIHLIRENSFRLEKIIDHLTMLNFFPARRALNGYSISSNSPPCPPCHCGLNDCECFPSTATVKLENGKTVTMSELQSGDKVETGMKSVTMSQLQIGQTSIKSVTLSELQIEDREEAGMKSVTMSEL